jgi:fatty acid-binding protein DegV
MDLAKQHLSLKAPGAEVLAVGHVDCEAEARDLIADLASQTNYPEEKILLVETGIALATHGGPGTLGIAIVSN